MVGLSLICHYFYRFACWQCSNILPILPEIMPASTYILPEIMPVFTYFENVLINCQRFLSTIGHLYLLPAWTWTTSTVHVLKRTISHPVISVLAGSTEYCHFGQLKFILPLCHKLLPNCCILPALCRQIRLKPSMWGGGGGGGAVTLRIPPP